MAFNTLNEQESRICQGEKPAAPALQLPLWLAIGARIFKFFASLKLAISILVSLMIIMAAGTILESLHGMDAARLLVYETGWFHAVLFLLGVNVLAAALDRLPWKKKHTGFVITHLGILIILTGSFITHQGMIDGQMAIAEGESEHRITLPEPLIYFYDSASRRDWILPLRKRPFAWEGREIPGRNAAAPLPVSLAVLRNFPKALGAARLVETASGESAALEITLRNSFINQNVRLIEADSAHGRTQVGPAVLSFAKEPLKIHAAAESAEPYLEFQFKDRKIQIPVPAGGIFPSEAALEGTPYRVRILKVFKNAVVAGRELMEQDGEGTDNPAVQLELLGGQLSEKHTAFANYPDFPTQHGMQPSAAEVKILYRLPGGGSRGESHELRFIYDRSAGQLRYQLQDGAKLTEGTARAGDEIATGWMDLQFKVEKFYPSARIERTFTSLPSISEDPAAVPAVEVEVAAGQDRRILWLEQGVRETVQMGGASYDLIYGQRRIPGGFKLELRDFKIDYYPGTNRPASFESDVTLKDSGRGVVREVTISMNKPLNYRGFHIYQSGYQLGEGAPEISVFSVGRDPGVPWKYAGTIVMVIGISAMFYMKSYSLRAGQAV